MIVNGKQRGKMTEVLTVVKHPLVRHKLTLMRTRSTPTAEFRQLLREIALLLGYEVLRDLPVTMQQIETPLANIASPKLEGKKLVLVSILRAGTGLLDGLLDLVPAARVGHIGLYRDPDSLEAVEYYFKVPGRLDDRLVVVVDPMLATGNSAVTAVTKLKEAGAKNIKFLCLIAAPEGVKTFHTIHPEISIYTAAVDDYLNDHGYIIPGLGDAGDRLYGTK